MKAENRVGAFDILIRNDNLIGPRANIWIARSGEVNDNGHNLPTIGWEAASYSELKRLVEALKHDLDVLLKKSRQHFDD